MQQAPAAIIMAAGKGTRMKSELPKVAHEAAGSSLVLWVARACRDAGCSRIVVVVGHGQEIVRGIFEQAAGEFDDVEIVFAVQEEQLGTGHAAMCARPLLGDHHGDVFVLVGDGPLLQSDTLVNLHDAHTASGGPLTLATAELDDPTGYGRIVRDSDGSFVCIVEHKEATQDQLAINEVNPSIYCFRTDSMFESLQALQPSELSGEYYITDTPRWFLEQGKGVEVVKVASALDAMSVNTPAQLQEVDDVLRARLQQPAQSADRSRH